MNLDIKDLRREVGEIRDKYPMFTNEDCFVMWFLRAHCCPDFDAAKNSLVGGPKDKRIDAIYIDDKSRSVFLVQGKFRRQLNQGLEPKAEVVGFAGLAKALLTQEDAFEAFVEDMHDLARDRLREARKRLREREYRLHLRYVTTGRCSRNVINEAEALVRYYKRWASFGVITGTAVIDLLDDYLVGIAPTIPEVAMTVSRGAPLSIYDDSTGMETWIFATSGDELVRLFEYADVRIFAKNIRGYLGRSTRVNEAMAQTIRDSPEEFLFLNNGITIVCDHAQAFEEKGKSLLLFKNPQIVNGQQTTRTLVSRGKQSSKCEVLVRAVRLPDQHDEHFVSRLVEATNNQNAISRADLKANDPIQLELERSLNKYGYQYLRKRQTRSEARRAVGTQHAFQLTKEELAKAVADCRYKSLSRIAGIQPLFDKHYDKLFDGRTKPETYLCYHWTYKRVNERSRDDFNRSWTKLVVVHSLWRLIGSEVTARSRDYLRLNERRDDSYLRVFSELTAPLFSAALASYRANRGSGNDKQDIVSYHKSETAHRYFDAYWMSRKAAPYRARFDKWRDRFSSVLRE